MQHTDWKAEAERRRVLRHALDLSLIEVAARVGVDASQVHRWERCKSLPRADVWERWEQALTKEETCETTNESCPRSDTSKPPAATGTD